MNIAFPAIVIVLLVLPGILFRYAYRKGVFRPSPVVLGPITEEVAGGALVALLFHAAAMLMIDMVSDVDIDFPSLIILLTQWPNGDKTSTAKVWDAIQLGYHEYFIIGYLIVTNTVALLLGYFFHFIVTAFYLDLIYPKFRFRAEWHYLLTGQQELLDFFKTEKEEYLVENYSLRRRICARWRHPLHLCKYYKIVRDYKKETRVTHDFVRVSAFVDYEGGEVLLQGSVSDYHLTKDGQLETLILELWTSPFDPTAEEEPKEDSEFDEEWGGHWVVKNSQIITLNVDIISVNDLSDSVGDHAVPSTYFSDINRDPGLCVIHSEDIVAQRRQSATTFVRDPDLH